MCDTEFTIEQGKLWMLQTRVGKRTGAAALRMAVDMTKGRKWKITTEEAVQRITAEHLDQVLHPQFAAADDRRGAHQGPGRVAGRRRRPGRTSPPTTPPTPPTGARRSILVRSETSPEDVHGMIVAEGILTARGGLVSHAAVVARGWGKPAVVGAEAVTIAGRPFTAGDVVVNEGDVISISTAHRSRSSLGGELPVKAPEAVRDSTTILGVGRRDPRGQARACGPTPTTAPTPPTPAQFGAEGIGLCRTEHMFLGEDRLPIVRRMILADTAEEEAAALEELRVVQKADFVEILEAMDGLPVTVRLLDPPLHEFLPVDRGAGRSRRPPSGLTDEEQRAASTRPRRGTSSTRCSAPAACASASSSPASTPCRCGRSWRPPPSGSTKGGKPVVEIMIPLTVTREELALARGWVEDAIAEAAGGGARSTSSTSPSAR